MAKTIAKLDQVIIFDEMGLVKYLKNHLPVIGVCVIGGSLMPLIYCRACLHSIDNYIFIALYSVCIWVSMWLGNDALHTALDRFVLWERQPITRLIVSILSMLVYTVSAVLLLVWIFESASHYTLGNVNAMVYFTVIVTTFITIVLTSRSFFLNWRQMALNAEKFEREGIEAKYDALRNQVNPHFLFNSLNALTNLVYEDQRKAVTFIKQLSDVYRYVLDTREKEIVPLEEEIKFLKSYLFLQQIRFGDSLRIDMMLNNTEGMVAPLSLQMLVENCIKHNVVSKDDPLHIGIFREGNFLVVENRINKKLSDSETSSGVGLDNIHNRYKFLSDTTIQVIEAEGKFIVKLPILKPNEGTDH